MDTGKGNTVTAEQKSSIFTQNLATRLAEEGIRVPPYLIALLDRPFASFTDDDRKLYESQIKGKELLLLFSRLLAQIYEAAPDATKHSWKGMCHLLKDSPIKVCVTYAIQAEGGAATAAGGPAAGEEAAGAAAAGGDSARKSFFTKKLERKMDERGVNVPAAIIALLDKPFDDFTPEEERVYAAEFESRQLNILFSDLLFELYEETGKVSSGWTAMIRYLKDTPMRRIATLVIEEEERLEEVAKETACEEPFPDRPAREKIYVKPYKPEAAQEKGPRWRKKA